jgi:hypothetical protein
MRRVEQTWCVQIERVQKRRSKAIREFHIVVCPRTWLSSIYVIGLGHLLQGIRWYLRC